MADIKNMTMEEYMARTRTDHGAGVIRPRIKDDISFRIKSHILKGIRETSFGVTEEEDTNEHMWHDGANGRRMIMAILAGLATITTKLDKLGHEVTKVNESVHAFQVGCDVYQGCHLSKDFPLKDEAQIEEVKLKNSSNNEPTAKQRVIVMEEEPKQVLWFKSLKIFKINTLIADAFRHRSLQVLKDVITRKKKLKEITREKLSERVSIVFLEEFLYNKGNDGNLSIPCLIYDVNDMSALIDLGANVNIMPLSTFQKLRLEIVRPSEEYK
ncbi:hypothetical protein Tco_1248088 [Tanacetum coccineum]